MNGSNKRMRELQAIFEAPPRVRVVLFFFMPSSLLTRSHSPFLRHSTASHSIGKLRITRLMTSRVSSVATSLICLYVVAPTLFYQRAPPDVRACHLGARDTI